MKKFILAAMASGLALAAATPASAGIFIGIAVNNGTTVQVASDGGTLTTPGTGSASYNPLLPVNGYTYNVGATGFPLLNMPQLLTQSINIQQAGGANALIDVYITMTGLTTPIAGLRSSYTSNTQTGLNATLTSYFSSSNALFSGTELYTANFGPSDGLQTSSGINAFSPGALYSETVRYRLNFTGGPGSNFNGTANLTAAVPEPATWAMMIAGFGLVGGVMRRRKTSVAFA